MKEVTIKLYDVEELEPKAFTKAYDEWRQHVDDPFMQSHMINLLKEKLEERGMAYDVDSIDVRYSLAHCQGDGFMFEGILSPDYGAGRCYTAKIKHSGHYYHKYSRTIEWLDADTGQEDDTEEGQKDLAKFIEMYEEICKEMEEVGYSEIEYKESEEVFKEECEANEWTFEADGTMRNN